MDNTIGPLQSGYLGGTPQEKRKVEKKEKVRKSFSSLISTESTSSGSLPISSIDNPDLPLEEILDEIHEMGEQLSQAPTMSAVLEYKKAVRQFVQYVVSRGLELVEQEGVKFANPMKKQKKYTIVRILDQKLESLAAQILQNQKSRLDILAAVNEIHGLMIDLLR